MTAPPVTIASGENSAALAFAAPPAAALAQTALTLRDGPDPDLGLASRFGAHGFITLARFLR